MSASTELRHALPSDDALHVVDSTDPELVETMYFGFSVPEIALNVEVFHWFHPVIGSASGGVIAFRGNRRDPLLADALDHRAHMPYPGAPGLDLEFPTGARVRVVDPLERVELSYSSADFSFEVTCTAIMPAVGPADGHLCQSMKTAGWVELDGERHVVDGYFTRDRSWGSPRTEAVHPVPAVIWLAAVFGDDLALHTVGFDSAAGLPQNLQWGYVWAGGDVVAVTDLDLSVDYDSDGGPTAARAVITDANGTVHEVTGRRRASLPFSIWPNMITEFVQMEWTLADRTGTGDLQSVQFPTFRRSVVM